MLLAGSVPSGLAGGTGLAGLTRCSCSGVSDVPAHPSPSQSSLRNPLRTRRGTACGPASPCSGSARRIPGTAGRGPPLRPPCPGESDVGSRPVRAAGRGLPLLHRISGRPDPGCVAESANTREDHLSVGDQGDHKGCTPAAGSRRSLPAGILLPAAKCGGEPAVAFVRDHAGDATRAGRAGVGRRSWARRELPSCQAPGGWRFRDFAASLGPR